MSWARELGVSPTGLQRDTDVISFFAGKLTRPLLRTSALEVMSLLVDGKLLHQWLLRRDAGSQASRTAPSTYLRQWPVL